MKKFIKSASHAALKTTLIYGIFAIGWILFSDQLVLSIINDPFVLTKIQTFKGLFFVLISSLLIFILNFRGFQQQAKISLELEYSRKDLFHMMNSAWECIWITDNQGNITKANKTFCEMIGYSLQEVIGTSIQQYFDTPSEQTLQLTFPKFEKTEYMDLNFRDRDGNITWVIASLNPIHDADNTFKGTAGFAINITNRKEIEQALHHSQERYQYLFESSPVSLWEQDLSQVRDYIDRLKNQGITDFESYLEQHPTAVQEIMSRVIILDVNQASVKMHHAKDKNDLLRNIPKTLAFSENSEALKKEILAICTNQTIFKSEASIRTIDNEKRDVLLQWSSNSTHPFDFKRVILSFIDITDRKQAELALEKSESRLRLLLNSQGEGTVLFNMNGDFEIVNPAAERLFGVPKETLHQYNLTDFLDPQSAKNLAGEISNLTAENQLRREISILGKDNIHKELLMTLTPWMNFNQDQVIGALAVCRDITQQKDEERKLHFQSTHDSLTDLYNRLYFELKIEELTKAQAFPISLMIADVDGLKIINDSKGHLAGDILLQRVAKLLETTFRKTDIVTRIGGDEFAVILPDTDEKTAGNILDRLQLHIDEVNQQKIHPNIKISYGMATAYDAVDMTHLFASADKAMYREKLRKRPNNSS